MSLRRVQVFSKVERGPMGFDVIRPARILIDGERPKNLLSLSVDLEDGKFPIVRLAFRPDELSVFVDAPEEAPTKVQGADGSELSCG